MKSYTHSLSLPDTHVRFLLDADLPRSSADVVRRLGHEVVDVRDVGLRKAPDDAIASYARREGLCLITADFDFSDLRAYPPRNYPGLVVLTLHAGRGGPSEADLERMEKRGAELLEDAVNPEEIQRVVERHKGSPEEAGVRSAAAQRLSEPEAVEETEHFLLPYVTLLEPNPRSMKRLVNAFGLAQSVNLLAHVDVPLDQLALWTILRQRWPELAELLGRHPDLLESFDGDEQPMDPRIPKRLRSLFMRPGSVRWSLGKARGRLRWRRTCCGGWWVETFNGGYVAALQRQPNLSPFRKPPCFLAEHLCR